MWSIAKTCPINPEYHGQWYFYEDTGELAEKELARPVPSSAAPSGQPGQQSPRVAGESGLVEDYQLLESYYAMRGYVRQAYSAASELEDFRWDPFDSLTWESTDEYGVDSSALMSQVLPSADTVKPLLTQCDKCNALAAKIWLERPLAQPETTAQDTEKATTLQWLALCSRLRSELDEAERQAAELQSDAIEQYADIEHSLSTSPSSVPETYTERFQTRCAEYTGLFNVVRGNLEQAERLAVKLRCWQPGSPVTATD